MREYIQNCKLDKLLCVSTRTIQTDILRLDLLHPIVSGNKWFKLQYYLEEALMAKKHTIASFGGAYSNHIVALAYAAKEKGLQSIGFIRGEMVDEFNPTLLQAKVYGMKLAFIDRNQYRNKELIIQQQDQLGIYWIMEGGYGIPGAKGAANILTVADTRQYSHILCAVGTGTMMAGLIKGAGADQQVIGISVLKNHFGLENEIRLLLTDTEKQRSFSILHDYHFGGYAKHPKELINFMKEIWLAERIPTDIVYTSKLLFAIDDLIKKNHFPPGSRLLLIHSGGLQGNSSLSPGTLPF